MSDIVELRKDGSVRCALLCDEPSMTKQSEAGACDINKIMAKYEKTGLIAHVNQNAAFYADVSAVPDYRVAFEIVERADDLFMSLPAEIRSRFDNDPALYLDFVSNPANKDELVKMGILRAPVVETAVAAPVVAAPVVAPAVVPEVK